MSGKLVRTRYWFLLVAYILQYGEGEYYFLSMETLRDCDTWKTIHKCRIGAMCADTDREVGNVFISGFYIDY